MKRIKKQEDESPKNNYFKYAKVGIVIFLVVISLEIWMVNRLTTYGAKIQQLKDAQASLQLENQVLENQLAQNTSLVSIEPKAQSLGFIPIKDFNYLKPNMLASANRVDRLN